MAETLINGYTLLAICGREPSETISFSEIVNELGEGYDDSILYGSNTGNREFALEFPVLANYTTSRTVELDGVLLTPAEYLWELFCRQKVSGTPLVIQSARNNQYYLVKFKDSSLTQKKMVVALYSGSAIFKQIRRSGVTVFDVSQISRVSHWYKTPIASAIDNTALPDDIWTNSISGGEEINSTLGVTYQTNEQNGLPIVRLDTTGGADGISTAISNSFHEAFLVMKMREATFAENVGIISNNDSTAGSPAILGGLGTTKFYNLGLGDGYTFKKNGIEYAESDQQAPMNEFGLVHIQSIAGWTMADGLLFGRDRPGTFPLRNANVDFGEIIICSSVLPKTVANELTESLLAKWGI